MNEVLENDGKRGRTPLPEKPTYYGNDPWIFFLKFPLNDKEMEVLNKVYPALPYEKAKRKWGKKAAAHTSAARFWEAK
jgi:hypothetical protein